MTQELSDTMRKLKQHLSDRIQKIRQKPMCDLTDEEMKEYKEYQEGGWKLPGARGPAPKSIRELCEDCDWTAYQLSKETGLNYKLVKGHVKKGKGFSLQTRRKYEKAFSEALGCKIVIAK